jgi:hypothetical protein
MSKATLEPFERFAPSSDRPIRFVLTDIDDTLTENGVLAARTVDALERLRRAGFTVVAVTAAPAGWCDMIARLWPIDSVVAENGGLYFHKPSGAPVPERRFWHGEAERRTNERRLAVLAERVIAAVPGTTVAVDQPYRQTSFAFDAPRSPVIADSVLRVLAEAGANATVNSLWVLAWFGNYDKLAMSKRMMTEVFGLDLVAERDRIVYVGDSLNDEPMFGFFPNSVGVATVTRYLERMVSPPRWITRGAGGSGFVEVADKLLR